MKKLCALVPLFLLAALPAAALSLPNRVFASARTGNDTNPCDSIFLPCQTLAGALAKVNAGGEVIILETGGYGAATISQSVTVEAALGIVGFIHPASGDAITISAGPSDVVTLRGLVLNVGTGFGIKVNQVGQLHVESCAINGFNVGLQMGSAGGAFIKDTIVRECTTDGIVFAPPTTTSVTLVAYVDHCRLDRDHTAVSVAGGVALSIRDSVLGGNQVAGVAASGAGSDVSQVAVHNSALSSNSGTAVSASGPAGVTVAVHETTLFHNTTGLAQSGSAVLTSTKTNFLFGNGSDTNGGTIGTLPLQ